MTAITPGHLGGPAAAVEEALPPAGPGGGGAQPALAAVVAVVDGGVAPGQTGVICYLHWSFKQWFAKISQSLRRPLLVPSPG